jgi:large exoprotein involved in heme utilization and adhesion
VLGRSYITTITRDAGDAGPIDIVAESLTVNGGGTAADAFGITAGAAVSLTTPQPDGGDAGDITIGVGSLTLRDNALIGASTESPGSAGGDIRVTARDLVIDGRNDPLNGGTFTGIVARTQNPRERPRLRNPSPGGSIRVEADRISLRSAGRIAADARGPGVAGDISIVCGSLDVSGFRDVGGGSRVSSGVTGVARGGGTPGRIAITARDAVTLDAGGQIAIDSTTPNRGGSIRVDAGKVDLADGASIRSDTVRGVGGAIVLNVRDLTLTGGEADHPTAVVSRTTGAGDGGTIDVAAAGLVSLFDNGRIDASTSATGRGGSVRIRATSLSVRGLFGGSPRVSANGAGGGPAGSVDVEATDVDVSDGGLITARGAGASAAGSVRVVARETLSIDQGSTFDETGLSVAGDSGTATDLPRLTVEGDTLRVVNGGTIRADAAGTADAADIVVRFRNVELDSQGFDVLPTGLLSQSLPGAFGRAGAIRLENGDRLALAGTARIDASTAGSGEGGSIRVDARQVRVRGDKAAAGDAGLALIAARAFGDGRGGEIVINAQDFDLRNARITSTAETEGTAAPAGGVTLNAQRDLLAASSRIGSFSRSTGQAGSVVLKAGRDLTLRGRTSVNVDGLFARGGDIVARAGRHCSISDASGLRATSRSTGGTVTIAAGDRLTLDASRLRSDAQGSAGGVTATAQSARLTDRTVVQADSGGSGGNVTFSVRDSLRLDGGSVVNANAGPAGGAVSLDGRAVLVTEGSVITAVSAATRVPVNIRSAAFLLSADSAILTDAPNFNVTDATTLVVEPPYVRVYNADDFLQQLCGERVKTVSSFMYLTRGGMPTLIGGYVLPPDTIPRR